MSRSSANCPTVACSAPAQAWGAFWPLGFSQVLSAEGSLYVQRPGQRVLTLAAGTDTLGFASDPANFTETFHLSTANRLTVATPNPHKMNLTLTPATGEVRGTFRDSGGKTRSLQGVALPAQNEISGFFREDATASDWSLTPH